MRWLQGRVEDALASPLREHAGEKHPERDHRPENASKNERHHSLPRTEEAMAPRIASSAELESIPVPYAELKDFIKGSVPGMASMRQQGWRCVEHAFGRPRWRRNARSIGRAATSSPAIAPDVALPALTGVDHAISGAMMPRPASFLLRAADSRTAVMRDQLGGDPRRGALFILLGWRRSRAEALFCSRRGIVLAAAGTDLWDDFPGQQIGAREVGGHEPRGGLRAVGSKREAQTSSAAGRAPTRSDAQDHQHSAL
ncbi:hypothetical protein WMF37_25105 [Sorangium sp. So ce291]|uniref:hypothetical protein n=1 Tax=Sorangium sp. So ce291 TaxID=3133294 RepID=UPI003F611AE5